MSDLDDDDEFDDYRGDFESARGVGGSSFPPRDLTLARSGAWKPGVYFRFLKPGWPDTFEAGVYELTVLDDTGGFYRELRPGTETGYGPSFFILKLVWIAHTRIYRKRREAQARRVARGLWAWKLNAEKRAALRRERRRFLQWLRRHGLRKPEDGHWPAPRRPMDAKGSLSFRSLAELEAYLSYAKKFGEVNVGEAERALEDIKTQLAALENDGGWGRPAEVFERDDEVPVGDGAQGTYHGGLEDDEDAFGMLEDDEDDE